MKRFFLNIWRAQKNASCLDETRERLRVADAALFDAGKRIQELKSELVRVVRPIEIRDLAVAEAPCDSDPFVRRYSMSVVVCDADRVASRLGRPELARIVVTALLEKLVKLMLAGNPERTTCGNPETRNA